MTELVEHLADLTALRDRDALDLALVSAVVDLLQPEAASICRLVGELGDERWRICAQLVLGRTASSDSVWSKMESLPPQSQFPLRQLAASSLQAQQSTTITVLPLTNAPESIGVLEIRTNTKLPADSLRLVQGILRLYVNFSNLLDYGERDSLTELLNRKTFDGSFLKATVEQKMSGLTSHDVPFADTDRRDASPTGSYWLAMIDIDHFKRVNDNYGHLIA